MNRIKNSVRPFPPYSPTETYTPQRRCGSEARWLAWPVRLGAAVLLGSVLFGFLMRDGRILLPPDSVIQPGSRQNPVSSSGKCTIESLEKDTNGSYFRCRSIWALQKVLRGKEAYVYLSGQIGNLSAPEDGAEYLVLQQKVSYLQMMHEKDKAEKEYKKLQDMAVLVSNNELAAAYVQAFIRWNQMTSDINKIVVDAMTGEGMDIVKEALEEEKGK